MSCNDEKLYAQGIYNFDFYDLTTDELIFQSRAITEGNIATSVNLNEIRGGIGNAVQIQIPSDATLTVSMTAANFSLEGLALNTGSTIMPNGKYQVSETITLAAEGSDVIGTVTSTPVAPLGSTTDEVIGYINCNEKVEIDPTTKKFVAPGMTAGDKVCIYYYTESASAEVFRIGSNFSPKIGRAVLRTPLYTSTGAGGTGSIVAGELQIVIPKAQLNGDLSLDLSQTSSATTVLNMTALADDNTAAGECQTNDGTLGYIIKVRTTGSVWDSVSGLAIIGGPVSLEVGDTEKLAIKGVSKYSPNTLLDVPYSDLTFTSGNTSVATVTNAGVVTAEGAGDTGIVVTYTPKSLSVRADVQVVS